MGDPRGANGSGVRTGMTVKDGAGTPLGKVRRVYAWGFEVGSGFWSPREWVFRYDEVLRASGDVVEVSRRPDDLLRLSAGELPDSWRRGTPPGDPHAKG